MYLEIDEGFLEHPKTMQLCATMGNPLAFGYLLHFWRWACRSCKDGDLSGLSEYVVEEAAKYHQHDGKLFKAMAAKLGGKAGFIDVDDSGAPVRIHNWDKHTGGAIARMDAKVNANKERREAARLKHETSSDAGTMPELCRHDAGQSRPDKTSQVKSSQESLPARDPCTADTVPPVPATHTEVEAAISGQMLLTMFGQARSKVFPTTLPWSTARDSKGDAGSFAAMLGPDEKLDVKASMQLALEHIRDGVDGWSDPRLGKDPSFAFGAWKSGFHALREEMHGKAPKPAKAKSNNGRHTEEPKTWKIVER